MRRWKFRNSRTIVLLQRTWRFICHSIRTNFAIKNAHNGDNSTKLLYSSRRHVEWWTYVTNSNCSLSTVDTFCMRREYSTRMSIPWASYVRKNVNLQFRRTDGGAREENKKYNACSHGNRIDRICAKNHDVLDFIVRLIRLLIAMLHSADASTSNSSRMKEWQGVEKNEQKAEEKTMRKKTNIYEQWNTRACAAMHIVFHVRIVIRGQIIIIIIIVGTLYLH